MNDSMVSFNFCYVQNSLLSNEESIELLIEYVTYNS